MYMAEETGANANNALILSQFLRECGIDSCVDHYYQNDMTISTWTVWTEEKIKRCIEDEGFILLLCSTEMKNSVDKNGNIVMASAQLDHRTFQHYLRLQNNRFIPVCGKENDQLNNVPISLQDERIYQICISHINLDLPREEVLEKDDNLRSLVATLTKQPETPMADINSGAC